jgi:hypothetical protein
MILPSTVTVPMPPPGECAGWPAKQPDPRSSTARPDDVPLVEPWLIATPPEPVWPRVFPGL